MTANPIDVLIRKMDGRRKAHSLMDENTNISKPTSGAKDFELLNMRTELRDRWPTFKSSSFSTSKDISPWYDH